MTDTLYATIAFGEGERNPKFVEMGCLWSFVRLPGCTKEEDRDCLVHESARFLVQISAILNL